jgi:endonuclease/exonuclease/phosphatase family metal-dependent hydrolase
VLRVLTYNIHHGADGRGRLDLARIADTIAGCEPDIVALQEVDRRWGSRSDGEDQPRWLGDRLGMTVHFAANVVPAPRQPTVPSAGYGLALLSRWSLSAVTHHTYSVPADARGERRGFLEGTVYCDRAGGSASALRVVNTHLSAVGGRFRRAQVQELLDHVGPARLPTVVAGDFNAGPRSRAVRQLRVRYQDAWRAGSGAGATIRGRRIDYLWVSAQLRPVRTWVVRSSASDHLPVVSDLERS